MASENGPLLKQSGFMACSLLPASLGFVLGFACFAGRSISLDAYGRFWLFVTACLGAVYLLGLAIDQMMRRSSKAPLLLTLGSHVGKAFYRLRLSMEHRFRGDRTDEEYQRAEGGAFFVALVLIVIAMLFTVGVWTLAVVALLFWLSLARNVFVAFNGSQKYGYKSSAGFMALGFFLALLYGLFHGFA